MTVAQGVPVARGVAADDDVIDITTDGMTRGRSIGSPTSMVNRMTRSSEAFNTRMQSRSAMVTSTIVKFLLGILVPSLSLYTYYTHALLPNGEEVPCDKPVAGWLHTYGSIGVLLGSLNLWMDIRKFQLLPAAERARDEVRRAAASGDEEAQLRAAMPMMRDAGAMGCVQCCVVFPLAIFLAGWWVKGNFDVWGTYPREVCVQQQQQQPPSGARLFSRLLLLLPLLSLYSLSALSLLSPCSLSALSASQNC